MLSKQSSPVIINVAHLIHYHPNKTTHESLSQNKAKA